MTISCRAVASLIGLLIITSPAMSQSTAAPPSTSASAKTSGKAAPTHTEASFQCSKEADAKGLHGKERKKFRSQCKKAGAK